MVKVRLYDKNIKLLDVVDVNFINIYLKGLPLYTGITPKSDDTLFNIDKYNILEVNEYKHLEISC